MASTNASSARSLGGNKSSTSCCCCGAAAAAAAHELATAEKAEHGLAGDHSSSGGGTERAADVELGVVDPHALSGGMRMMYSG